jgi:hypothetical protein
MSEYSPLNNECIDPALPVGISSFSEESIDVPNSTYEIPSAPHPRKTRSAEFRQSLEDEGSTSIFVITRSSSTSRIPVWIPSRSLRFPDPPAANTPQFLAATANIVAFEAVQRFLDSSFRVRKLKDSSVPRPCRQYYDDVGRTSVRASSNYDVSCTRSHT